MPPLFEDRSTAGRLLAQRLRNVAAPDTVVLALPRGGVPVAVEIARALKAPLDVVVVRKIGAPWQPELALGAVAEGGVQVLDEANGVRHGVAAADVQREAAVQREELQRRVARYRAGQPPLPLAGRACILVDDGVATGFTMRAALRALRQRGAAAITVAVPVAPRESVRELEREGLRVVCLAQPDPFVAVGLHYRHFPQVQDEEVTDMLRRSRAY